MKRILILGGNGRTGRHAIDYALSPTKKLEVVALVRDAGKLGAQPGLTIVEGTPEKLADVQRAIRGCDAVLSFLSNPPTALGLQVSQPGFLTLAATNAVTAMKAEGIRRIVVLTALGVGDSIRLLPAPARWFVANTFLGQVFADHAGAEAMLDAADVDWTSVRAALLAGRKLTRTRLSEHGDPKPSPFISRKTVATFMVDSLLHREFFGKALIASRD
jgi:uncharacterized protein YbjT (DUF2867 family)